MLTMACLRWIAPLSLIVRAFMGSPNKTLQAVLLGPRISIGKDINIGPGKIALLRQVDSCRSISGAARAMGMTYKRAWLLIDTLNRGFGQPVVEASVGGKGGGGASLTPLGATIVARFTALEASLQQAAQSELGVLCDLVGSSAEA